MPKVPREVDNLVSGLFGSERLQHFQGAILRPVVDEHHLPGLVQGGEEGGQSTMKFVDNLFFVEHRDDEREGWAFHRFTRAWPKGTHLNRMPSRFKPIDSIASMWAD